MIFNVITLFPETISCFFKESILKRAVERGLITIHVKNPRDYSKDSYKKVDDYPFGGGSGMILMPDPLFRVFEDIEDRGFVVSMSPRGYLLTQEKVKDFARKYKTITVLCGHYEGIDQRVINTWVNEEISIGDYVITGGESAAVVLIDAITRQLEYVLGNEDSKLEESFDETGLLEYDHYTRPEIYRNLSVPKVLLSGNHREIRRWRMRQRLVNTLRTRPDLLVKKPLSHEYRRLLEEIEKEQEDGC